MSFGQWASDYLGVPLEERFNFNPLTYFLYSGIDGAWFDPSDMSTLYQDAAGTIPVTAIGQPVGLWLDKSQGLELGPELVSNGTFDSGTEGWVSSPAFAATITEIGGVCSFTSVNSSARIRPPVITTNIGAMYTVTITILSLATTVIVRPSLEPVNGLSCTSLGDLTVNSVGTYTFMFKARTTTTYLWVLNNGAIGTVVSLDNISVRELYGYHATQSITAYRPALMQDIYGHYYLAFDGINNCMSLGDVFDVGINGVSMIAAATVRGGERYPIAGKSITAVTPGRYFLGANSNLFAYAVEGLIESGVAYTPVIGAPTVYNMTLSAGSSHRMSLRVNGTLIGDVPTSLPEASNTSLDFMIGQYPNFGYLNGRNYGLIVTAKALSVGQAAICERYLYRKSGVQL